MRGIMHWMAGLTLFWVLIASLWMPWIDYGKSYRPVSASLSRVLPANADCVANVNIPDSVLATLDYFSGIRAHPFKDETGKRCHWLLVQGEVRDPAIITAAGWRKVWEDRRPGDRHENDKFQLFQRRAKAKTQAESSDFASEEVEEKTP